jgi:hypothetical protein
VVELTDVYTKEAYPKLNRRTRKAKEIERLISISPEAQTIKYADIIDNAKEIGKADAGFAPVYLRECKIILQKLDKGNQPLHEQAKNFSYCCCRAIFSAWGFVSTQIVWY